MINTKYKLLGPKQFGIEFHEEIINENKIVIRPTYLSVCAADMRYYQGKRSPEVLKKKLPMCLIHEAVGEVVYDPSNAFGVGEKIVMLPLIEDYNEVSVCRSNYNPKYKFRSSSADGFMQSFCVINKEDAVSISGVDERAAVLCELMTVAINSIDKIKYINVEDHVTFGVWGCGSLGFVLTLLLKTIYKNATVKIVGPELNKLQHFTFTDDRILLDGSDKDIVIDHAFECVGGTNSSTAINQIIDNIKPEGTISLLGVSEELVDINTRLILEKGLTLHGNSRSNKTDYETAIDILRKNPNIVNYLETIISEEVLIESISDMHKAFEASSTSDFKTIMKWRV